MTEEQTVWQTLILNQTYNGIQSQWKHIQYRDSFSSYLIICMHKVHEKCYIEILITTHGADCDSPVYRLVDRNIT